MIRSFLDAIRLLTILPLPAGRDPARPALLYWFPAAGLVVGLILAGMETGLTMAVESVNIGILTPLIVVALWLVLTRGLHIDGVADTFDALGAVADRARRLEILRDPRVGPIGVAAVALILIAKVWSLAAIAQAARGLAVVCAAVTARWVVVIGCAMFPYARPEGLGTAFIGKAGWRHILWTTVFTAGVLFLSKSAIAIPMLVAALVGIGIGGVAHRSFGGITGDVLGAIVEFAETAVLFVFVLRT
ncbi:MAG: cobalamin 5'-phosphate synthase [Candidatus Lindowbacteria bacterium RIFCSPLOWO2_12_FULL_62_27]|nr:MAG: cobalamin 5'-phosphate synthase [Candidatus Lindowbacteria bacterium RIFCSPLOWO2_12_FULL_62_27]OGH61508.1 MAG: cobalamin 5'-phosphate synthase [Candidatus Lindowbacteria bacterium RIFCSPLOWO2_02_FULL_62_12]